MRRSDVTTEMVERMPEATLEEAWACFNLFRRWRYPSDDIYVGMLERPARHVVVTLAKPKSKEALFDLYVGKCTTDPDAWLADWRAFALRSSSGGVTRAELEKMWNESRIRVEAMGSPNNRLRPDEVGAPGITPLIQAMLDAGLSVQR